MANTKYFVSKKILKQIVDFYSINERYKEHAEANKKAWGKVVYHKRKNRKLWLVIEYIGRLDNNLKVEVNFCDDRGYIIKRDKWIISRGIATFLEVSTEGKGCSPVWRD